MFSTPPLPGVRVGHYTDDAAATGCTVLLCPDGATCGVAVRGGGPGTRETDLLRPDTLVQHVHAVLLTGGSAFGLAAADGVMRWLEARGYGFTTEVGPIPIVPAAVLFDLGLGRADVRPDADAGWAACDAASDGAIAEGNVGAGTGATVGKWFGLPHAMKGGLGAAGRTVGNVTVGALVAVNALGDVVDTDGTILAGARAADGFRDTSAALYAPTPPPPLGTTTNTTLAAVVTNAVLTQAECTHLASVAHDGLARSIRPVHTLYDGDTVFALSTGNAEANPIALANAAADALADAVRRAVRAAGTLHGVPGLASIE